MAYSKSESSKQAVQDGIKFENNISDEINHGHLNLNSNGGDIYKYICKLMNIDINSIQKINAARSESNNSKADVIIKVAYYNNTTQLIGLSCKNSTENALSLNRKSFSDIANNLPSEFTENHKEAILALNKWMGCTTEALEFIKTLSQSHLWIDTNRDDCLLLAELTKNERSNINLLFNDTLFFNTMCRHALIGHNVEHKADITLATHNKLSTQFNDLLIFHNEEMINKLQETHKNHPNTFFKPIEDIQDPIFGIRTHNKTLNLKKSYQCNSISYGTKFLNIKNRADKPFGKLVVAADMKGFIPYATQIENEKITLATTSNHSKKNI